MYKPYLLGPPDWVLKAYGANVPSAALHYDQNLYWVKGYGSGPFEAFHSVSRTSTKYVTTSGGVLLPVAANVKARSDQGLLVEQAATNLIQQSSDLTQGAWTVTNGTPAANATAAPDGTTTASSLTDNVTSGAHNVAQSVAFTSGTTYAFSGYFKAGTASVVQLTFSLGAFSGGGYVNYNLANGTVGSSGGTLAGSGIIALGNGWYRCWFTAVATANASSAATIYLTNSNASVSRAVTYAGSGQTLYVWNIQIEAGTFITSPIPTTSSSATRAADVITLTGAAATAALAAKAARFETNFVAGGSDPRLYAVGGPNPSMFYPTASTNVGLVTDAGGTHQATAALGSGAPSGLVKSAFGFDATRCTAKGNGGSTNTITFAWGGTSGTPYLGNIPAGNRALNGYMRRATFGPTKGMFDGTTT